MNTTLNEIKKHNPCISGWKKLLLTLGKTEADNEPLSLKEILDSNGIDDAIWSLRVFEKNRLVRIFAGRCAEHVLHLFEDKYPEDKRPREAIDCALRGESAANAAAYAADAAYAAAASAAANAAYAAAAYANAAAYAAAAYANAAAYAAAAYAARKKEKEWQRKLFIEMFCPCGN